MSPFLSVTYDVHRFHRQQLLNYQLPPSNSPPPSKYFLPNLISCFACGVHLQITPTNTPHFFPPWGCTYTHYTPGYAYVSKQSIALIVTTKLANTTRKYTQDRVM